MGIVEKIESLPYISTYCFSSKHEFYLIIYFTANLETSQFNSDKETTRLTHFFKDYVQHNTQQNTNDT